MTDRRIFYWSPDYSTPVGGVKVLYRHVDILNDNGFNASVIHRHTGFRCTWFNNATRISYLRKIDFCATDYVVIPETYGSLYSDPASRPKAQKTFRKVFHSPANKVVFNQNCYNTFKGFSFKNDCPSIYKDKDILAAMVVSEDNKQYLNFVFPDLRIFRMHNSINQDLFYFSPDKKKLISFMPRKNSDHAEQVIAMLKLRGILDDFEIFTIEGMSEEQTAEVLRESMIFLSFGYPEGFSLPPAEAMACGCIVVGYHGMGGKEYFTPEYGFPVEMGDIRGFAHVVEDVIKTFHNNSSLLLNKAKNASAFIKDTYSKDREIEDVVNCWHSILH